MLGTIEVHAGDFTKGKASQYCGTDFTMKVPGKFIRVTIPIAEVESIDIATEESVKKIGGAVGWGVAGGLLLGPVGLLAGLLLGGKKNMVTFVCRFKHGRKFMGTTDSKTWVKIMAARF